MLGRRGVDPLSVAVIGGGIAGITAAIKLKDKGYHVTLFEKAEFLGGNLSSNSLDQNNKPFEVYPHIFGDWYEVRAVAGVDGGTISQIPRFISPAPAAARRYISRSPDDVRCAVWRP